MLDENVVIELVRRKVVTDTFRRLPPDKKEQIYRATIRLFGEYGFDGLAVDRICREAPSSRFSHAVIGPIWRSFGTRVRRGTRPMSA